MTDGKQLDIHTISSTNPLKRCLPDSDNLWRYVAKKKEFFSFPWEIIDEQELVPKGFQRDEKIFVMWRIEERTNEGERL